MRTPNSPLFKRYEIIVGLAFAVMFIVAVSLNLVY